MISPIITFAMTNECTSACSLCCFSCAPSNKKQVLPNVEIERVIHEAAELGIKKVAFSGGEPFLCFDSLLSSVKLAHGLGMKTAVATNGYWGKDSKEAMNLIDSLADAGLNLITISTDQVHQEYIPVQWAKQALSCAKKRIETTCCVGEYKGGQRAADTIRMLENEVYGLHLTIDPWIPFNGDEDKEMKIVGKDANSCPQGCRTVTILWDGNVYPCCFPGMNKLFSFGNIYQESLHNIMKNMEMSDLMLVMVKNGPSWFQKKLEEKGALLKNQYVSGCHQCLTVAPYLGQIRQEIEQEAGKLRVQKLLNARGIL